MGQDACNATIILAVQDLVDCLVFVHVVLLGVATTVLDFPDEVSAGMAISDPVCCLGADLIQNLQRLLKGIPSLVFIPLQHQMCVRRLECQLAFGAESP